MTLRARRWKNKMSEFVESESQWNSRTLRIESNRYNCNSDAGQLKQRNARQSRVITSSQVKSGPSLEDSRPDHAHLSILSASGSATNRIGTSESGTWFALAPGTPTANSANTVQ